MNRILDIHKPEFIILAITLVFSYLSAFLVPQMQINDEGAHFLKSYSLSTGHLAGRTCSIPKSIVEKIKSESTAPNDDHIDYSDLETVSCGSAAGYTPIMHLPQSIGILISRVFGDSTYLMVLFGRLANATFYSLALFFIIRYARVGKWVFVVIGLFPLMIHTAGSLSADVMNNVVVFAFFAYTFNLFTQKRALRSRQAVILLLFSLLLALTKSTNIIFLLTLAALPAEIFNFRKYKPLVVKWIFILMMGILALGTLYICQKLLGSMLFQGDTVENPLVHDPLRFFYILYNTYINPALGYGDLVLRGVVGEFSAFRYHLPTWAVFSEVLLLILVLLAQKPTKVFAYKESLSRLSLAALATLLLFVLAVTLGLYSAWAILPVRLGVSAIYADGVQGRYFTAALLLLIPIGLWLQKYIQVRLPSRVGLEAIVLLISTLILAFYVAETVLTFS